MKNPKNPSNKGLDLSYEQLIENINTENQEYQDVEKEEDLEPYVREQTLRLIKQIALNEETEPETVFIAFAAILQSGGYLKGVSNRKILLTDKKFELTKRTIINAMKITKCGCTLRTIARHNRELIAEIAFKRKIPGNLYTQYKIHNPEILKQTPEEQWIHAKYCTDFQRENPNAPFEVIKFLSTREIKRKEKSK